MPLTLLTGPANAGKVALLLERYLEQLPHGPVLIVPNRSDVDRVERDLLDRCGALLGGEIGTFDDLFARIARGNGDHRPVLAESQRALLVRGVVDAVRLESLRGSARYGGFADALSAAIAEIESGLLDPDALDGELGDLYAAYRAELDRLGLWDRDLEHRYAAERVGRELAAWGGHPVFAYGFEDLTGSQWALLEALAGRSEVTVSLPYEPGRAVFSSLQRTQEDLARLAGGRIEELPPGYGEWAHPALAHLERALFDGGLQQPAPTEGAVRFLEGAGTRGALELVAEEILQLLRSGTPVEEIAIVCPSLDRWRAPLEAALGALGVPYAVDGQVRLGQTPYGHALLSLLRYAWLGGGRRELYAFMRSPYSGLSRAHVDFLEGRLRGRAVHTPERVEEETLRLRGQPLPFLERLRSAPSLLGGVRGLARRMLESAYGLEAPPVSEISKADLRAYQAVLKLLDELEGWVELGGSLGPDEAVGALEGTPVRLTVAAEAGRVAVLDLLRARTRRCQVVFVLGLEEGSLPRRTETSPFLDEDARRVLEERSRGARLVRADPVGRARYLFYAACTRASRRLYLVREAASDDGSPRQPSPFWDDVRAVFDPDDVARWTRRRPLSTLVWPLEEAPSDRERLRSVAALSASEPAAALGIALANGWERRLERARSAFERRTRLTHPAVLEELRRRSAFGVTELEVFADCSSIWLIERLVDPRSIDGELDPRTRGQVAHQTLFKFFSGLPKRLGADTVQPGRVEEAIEFLHECLTEAVAGQVGSRLDLTDLQRHELEQGLWRDLEQFVRGEVEAEARLIPRKFEVSFGSERSAPELQRGLDLGGFFLSGKIDRIDLDPFSARGIVQDYKSGKKAHSAAQIESELRLQIPLYMLVLRDLVGIEPLGGLYRALAGERQARGLLSASAREDVRGIPQRDYLPDDEFWAVVEKAVGHARGFVERMREGDVRHDPRGGFPCPTWCDLWSMCRVKRA